MQKTSFKNLYLAIIFIAAFVLWTDLLCFLDLKAIGPKNSVVGFSTLNQFVHSLTGVNMWLYTVTDWLGLVPIAFALGFGLLGFAQWINRKKITLVDYDLFVLGGFYLVVIAVYILFEYMPLSYRPVLINEVLEISYPSSTTILVMCVMPTAIMQFKNRIKNIALRKIVIILITTFILFMVIGRLISGVHWFTDIVGGALLSAGLVMTYNFFTDIKQGA